MCRDYGCLEVKEKGKKGENDRKERKWGGLETKDPVLKGAQEDRNSKETKGKKREKELKEGEREKERAK